MLSRDSFKIIKKHCIDLDIDAKKLSEELGVSNGFMYCFLNGKKKIKWEKLIKLADILKMSHEEKTALYKDFIPKAVADELSGYIR